MERLSLESHSIRIHPTLWQWAKDDAPAQGYEGGASGLISGLILYNHALRHRKHWLTADLVNDLIKLEKVMKEIEEHNPMAEGATWLDHRIEEVLGKRISPEETTERKEPIE